jgi:hypothetical protein
MIISHLRDRELTQYQNLGFILVCNLIISRLKRLIIIGSCVNELDTQLVSCTSIQAWDLHFHIGIPLPRKYNTNGTFTTTPYHAARTEEVER